jgi:mRNA interferase YafQ
MSKYEIKTSRKFVKDVKLAVRRGLDIEKLLAIVALLSQDEPLPENCRDHILKGNYRGYHECHIEPDWLLIYDKRDVVRIISLERTGTHSDLFG